jgi:hypothetical protein
MKRTTEIIGQARLGAFLLTPPIRARLVDDFGTAKKYRTINQPKTRKPRATKARRLIVKQVASFQPTDRGLALAEKRTREFYATESTGFELTLSLLRR